MTDLLLPYLTKLHSLCTPHGGRIITSMSHRLSSVVISLVPPSSLLGPSNDYPAKLKASLKKFRNATHPSTTHVNDSGYSDDPIDWADWHIIFEKRAAHITQGGEVCLPGGKIEPWESSHEAAFREWEEETGISKNHVEFLGFFGTLVHGAGRQIDVWLSLCPPLDQLAPEPNDEVDLLFSLSLGQIMTAPWKSYLLDQTIRISPQSPPVPFEKYQLKEYRRGAWSSSQFSVWFVEDLPELLWGMTAVIVRSFLIELFGSKIGDE